MRVRLTSLLLSLFLCFAALAQDQSAKLRELEAFVAREMKSQQMPAISIAIKQGDFIWARGFGLADVDNDVAATELSSYRMASVTKPMTAVAILKLADEGKIDLDAEVQTYVPYFPKKRFPITIRQLLSHQGGISHYKDYDKEGRIKDPKTTREAIAIFQDFDLVAEPGTGYNYSSYGFNLLGAVIEGASGKSYGQYLTENVWKPLGMISTRMDDPRAVIPHRVSGYTLDHGKLLRSEYVDISSRFGGGGTRSTVVDMVRFLDGLAHGKVLKTETRERAWTMAQMRNERLTHYGQGFGLYPRNGRYVIAHGGSQQETRTSMSYVPDANFTIAIASNFEDADLDPFENKLFELFLGDTPMPRLRGATLDDDLTLAALTSIYSNGLAYYSRNGRAMTTDQRELDEAMRYFRASLADRDKIDAGEHPLSGEAFTKLGSSMAASLAAKGSLDVYHHEGPLRFVNDFAALPANHYFGKPLLRRVQKWASAWSTLWTPAMYAFNVHAPNALTTLETFANAPVKPDYVEDLLHMGERAALANESEKALRIATVGVNVYPASPSMQGLYGVLTLIGGDHDRGMAALRKSLALDPNGYAGAKNLANIARQTPEQTAAIVRKASMELHGK